jgi:hypothetical protein
MSADTLVDCPQCCGEGYLYSQYIHDSADCDVCTGSGQVSAGFARLYDQLVLKGEDFVDECSQCHTRRVTVSVPGFGKVCAGCIVWVVVAMKAATP